MNWIKFVIFLASLFVASYLYLFIKSIFSALQIKKLNTVFCEYLNFSIPIVNRYDRESIMFGNGQDRKKLIDELQSRYLDDLVFSVPEINEVLSIGTDISRANDSFENFRQAMLTYPKILSEKDRRIYELFKCLSPFPAVKAMLLVPSNLLRLFGARPTKYFSRIFSLFGWIAAFLCGIFSDEIKACLLSFFQQHK